jgi:uncharacterized protein with HEPN domain
VTRDPRDRFADILAAIDRCLSYREHLADPEPKIAEMAYDAVLRNLAVIGEATRALPQDARELSPQTPWPALAGLRNIVVHEYFRIDRGIIEDILDNQLEPLAEHIRAHAQLPD